MYLLHPCLHVGGRLILVACLPLACLLLGCGDPGRKSAGDRALLVFAAASLRDVAQDLAAEFERRHGIEILFNFAGSNTLAQQIHAAPGADIFLSADAAWVDFLDQKGRAIPATRRAFLSNRLVLIARHDASSRAADPGDLARADYRHLAVAEPEGVPAGRYARAHLERLESLEGSLWDTVSKRLTPTLDVRATLALVESDPEILGLVYKTDAASSERVEVRYEFPPVPGIDITYWAVAVTDGERPDLAGLFLDFLNSPDAQALSSRHGFATPSPGPT